MGGVELRFDWFPVLVSLHVRNCVNINRLNVFRDLLENTSSQFPPELQYCEDVDSEYNTFREFEPLLCDGALDVHIRKVCDMFSSGVHEYG